MHQRLTSFHLTMQIHLSTHFFLEITLELKIAAKCKMAFLNDMRVQYRILFFKYLQDNVSFSAA